MDKKQGVLNTVVRVYVFYSFIWILNELLRLVKSKSFYKFITDTTIYR